MLFGGWADKEAGKALILQESRCGTTASEKIAVFEVVDATTLRISDGRKFRAIRYKTRSNESRGLQVHAPWVKVTGASSRWRSQW